MVRGKESNDSGSIRKRSIGWDRQKRARAKKCRGEKINDKVASKWT